MSFVIKRNVILKNSLRLEIVALSLDQAIAKSEITMERY